MILLWGMAEFGKVCLNWYRWEVWLNWFFGEVWLNWSCGEVWQHWFFGEVCLHWFLGRYGWIWEGMPKLILLGCMAELSLWGGMAELILCGSMADFGKALAKLILSGGRSMAEMIIHLCWHGAFRKLLNYASNIYSSFLTFRVFSERNLRFVWYKNDIGFCLSETNQHKGFLMW